jgi:hypothetical protein
LNHPAKATFAMNLVKRNECWVPTLWGWALLLVLFLSTGVTCVFTIHGFLSPVDPKKADVLIVEGWLPDYALESAVHEFKSRPYRLCIATGGPLEAGNFLSQYKSFAIIAVSTLRKLGIDSSQVVAVSAPLVYKDRTYASSIALKEWLDKSGLKATDFTVFSMGCHSRRSQMLFAKALGKNVSVGVIACNDRSYDSRRWWHYSAGLRMVTGETLAFVYGILFSLKE